MREIVVWAEQRDNRLLPVSLELLEKAVELAAQINGSVSSVIMGFQCRSKADELIHYGATRVFWVDDPCLIYYQSDLYPKILARILSEISPEIVLIGGTTIGMDLAPRVAANLRTGLTAHCVNLYIEAIDGKDQLIQVVPGWGGNMLVKIICPEHRPQMATVRPGVMEMGKPDKSRKGVVIPVAAGISDQNVKAKTIEFVKDSSEDKSIEEADIIVSGGFGMDSAGGFALIEELASAIHGEVAGTRPAFDQGYISESRMIGQSGKTVKPRLFISVGASGAIHYTTGFNKSKVIVGIDKNPKAPIFDMADLGIVGDLRKIIPCLIEELKKEDLQK
jgi:electron transfer flavoprotein alpha subunit